MLENVNHKDLLTDKRIAQAFFSRIEKLLRDCQAKFIENHKELVAPAHLSNSTFHKLMDVGPNGVDLILENLAVDFSKDDWSEKMELFLAVVDGGLKDLIRDLTAVYSQKEIDTKLFFSEEEALFIIKSVDEKLRSAFLL